MKKGGNFSHSIRNSGPFVSNRGKLRLLGILFHQATVPDNFRRALHATQYINVLFSSSIWKCPETAKEIITIAESASKSKTKKQSFTWLFVWK